MTQNGASPLLSKLQKAMKEYLDKMAQLRNK